MSPFFEGMFTGALTLFLLEMGVSAGTRLSDQRRAGLFLVAFGVAMPVLHGALSGLPKSGCPSRYGWYTRSRQRPGGG